MEGRAMIMFMNPIKQKQSQHEKEGAPRRDQAEAQDA
jgi:hypothetical protein